MIPVKSAAELEKMKRACAISSAALQAGGAVVRPGVTTAEIDRVIHDYIVSHGARPSFKGYGGFPGSACVSVNDTVIHGIPGRDVVVREGDIVSIDAGAFFEGFHGDNACTYPCGAVSEEAQKLMDVTKAGLFKGIEAAVPGGRVGDIGHAIQSYVEAFGFSVVRDFVGHGVGRELHEAPEIPNYGKPGHGPRLAPGMTIAIEPMINAGVPTVRILGDGWTVKTTDGELSAHFEHTVAITKGGPLVLTDW